jgi:hypothetical protein
MKMWTRLSLGVLLAVAALPLVGGMIELLLRFIQRPSLGLERLESTFSAGFVTGVLGIPFALGAFLLYAVPLFLWLRKLKRATLAACVLSAILPGCLLALTEGALWPVLAIGAYAVPCALVFWVVVRRAVSYEAT